MTIAGAAKSPLMSTNTKHIEHIKVNGTGKVGRRTCGNARQKSPCKGLGVGKAHAATAFSATCKCWDWPRERSRAEPVEAGKHEKPETHHVEKDDAHLRIGAPPDTIEQPSCCRARREEMGLREIAENTIVTVLLFSSSVAWAMKRRAKARKSLVDWSRVAVIDRC